MQEIQLPHKLTLQGRNNLSMTGVTEVMSFDENAVILHTELGTLIVQGKDLQLKTLSTDSGQVIVEGNVSALVYEEPRPSGGFWSRMFG